MPIYFREKADFIGLVEVFDYQYGVDLSRRFRDHGYQNCYYNMGSRACGLSSGLFFATKLLVENRLFVRFSESSLIGNQSNVSRGFFICDLSKVTVVLTHLSPSEKEEAPSLEEKRSREQQMNEIVAKIKNIRNRGVILIGDLNMDPNELENTSWYHLFEKRTSAGPTWKRGRPEEKELDYMLVFKNEVEPVITEFILRDAQFNESNFTGNSDHCSLVSEFQINEKASTF